ncbi:hypothetical protein IEQ44_00915 [Nocardioides sp. Y6]|uniref:DUF1772 domain-containing protein n=1 Tax=Nocardioides malaquae TaxID=2773426 RepID=A0ABR9RNR6_9ACTN|nr:hypothetical protein [Nocardioides malaquae]
MVFLGLVVAGALTGVVTGWLWELVWTPPTGAAWEGEWYLDRDGLLQDASATGWYTVVGLVAGIALGAVAARWVRGAPLVVLAGVVLGSLVHAWVMYQVGHLLGPDDPHAIARTAGDWEPIISDLRLAGVERQWWPFASTATLAPAVGALISLIGIFLGGPGRRHRRATPDLHSPDGARAGSGA